MIRPYAAFIWMCGVAESIESSQSNPRVCRRLSLVATSTTFMGGCFLADRKIFLAFQRSLKFFVRPAFDEFYFSFLIN